MVAGNDDKLEQMETQTKTQTQTQTQTQTRPSSSVFTSVSLICSWSSYNSPNLLFPRR